MALTTILNKENVETMWQIRKLVRREFGFELKISDQNAIEKLKDCENRTCNAELKELIRRITAQLETLIRGAAAPKNEPDTSRYYRGQRVDDAVNTQPSRQRVAPTSNATKPKRVYRGQLVSD